MLKQGLFILPDGSAFNIYEVTETGFYRLDIVREGADFLTDVDAVIYSIVRRKKTYVYGDTKLYDEFTRIRHEASTFKATTSNSESYWENGKFYQKYISEEESTGYLSETVNENGAFYHSMVVYKGYTIALDVLARIYNIKMDPLNFFEYEEVTLSKDIKEKETDRLYYPWEILRAKYPVDHLLKENYVLVTDVVEARKYLEIYKRSPEPLRGVDTETTGLDINIYGEDELVGVILAWSEHDSVYFPFRHKSFQNLPIEFLGEIVDAINHTYEKNIAHNKKFDINVFHKEGYTARIKWCTLQLAIILDNTTKKRESHSLKDLEYNITGKRFLELTDIFVSAKNIDFSVLDETLTRLYACPDSSGTIIVFKELIKKLPTIQHKLFETECLLSDLIAEQEYYGMRVDVKKYEEQYKNCNYIIDLLLRAFKTLTRFSGNINSVDALRDLIYYKMKCPVLSRTATGKPSTGANVVKKLANKQAQIENKITNDLVDLNGKVIISAKKLAQSKYPALLVLSKYREYIKLKTAFYARFENTMKTGRVFFWINQYGAASGRHSSPMHQLPSALKDVMLSDTPTHKFWGPDYSQVELRMIAYLAGEKDLIELCKDPNNDIHRVIGSLISGKEMWEITDQERSIGKRRNFGVVYDISAFGLAGQIMGPGYTKEDVKFCEGQIRDFMTRFKWIRRYMQENKRRVNTVGFMETSILHRTRGFYEIFDPNVSNKAKRSLERQANNMPVQGTAADLLKLGLNNMQAYIINKGWDKLREDGFPLVRVMLSIHDEILISADETIQPIEIVLMIRDCMEIEIEGAPPFFVEPAHMDCWGGHNDSTAPIPVTLREELIKEFKTTGKCRLQYDNYKDVINRYHDDRLENYMSNLIKKYGDDYKAVGSHVRDAALTFDLLALYGAQLKGFEGTQEEKITEATRLYMENVDTTVILEERETISDVESVFEEMAELVNYDKDGNIVYESSTEDEESEVIDDDDYDEYLSSGEVYRAWDVGDTLMVDLSKLKMSDANTIISEVFSKKDDTGFYKVLFFFNNQVLDPKFCVEDVNVEELSNKIVGLE